MAVVAGGQWRWRATQGCAQQRRRSSGGDKKAMAAVATAVARPPSKPQRRRQREAGLPKGQRRNDLLCGATDVDHSGAVDAGELVAFGAASTRVAAARMIRAADVGDDGQTKFNAFEQVIAEGW